MDKNKRQKQSTINMLNNDILSQIFDHLHLDDKIRLRRTCRRWKWLLDYKIDRLKALRIGSFQQGAYNVTSGLNMNCNHQSKDHRQHTGTLFNENILNFPADVETQCFSVKQFDTLHRALKLCQNSITMLSIGRLNVSYRLLMVITHNLPNLEHLELINCASDNGEVKQRNKSQYSRLPSVESFNTEPRNDIYSITDLYNQHQDEQVNVRERLIRSSLVRSCDLVKEAKAKNHWPNLKHLLVKECNLLNEFSLSLILALTSHSLDHLVIESNQRLTGEFLNYCGPKLTILRLKHCPLLQVKFLEDFVKLKQLLAQPTSSYSSSSIAHSNKKSSLANNSSSPQPFNSSMFKNLKSFNQDIYCML